MIHNHIRAHLNAEFGWALARLTPAEVEEFVFALAKSALDFDPKEAEDDVSAVLDHLNSCAHAAAGEGFEPEDFDVRAWVAATVTAFDDPDLQIQRAEKLERAAVRIRNRTN